MLYTQQIFMLTRPSPGHFMYYVFLSLLDFADVSMSSMSKTTHWRANYKVNSYWEARLSELKLSPSSHPTFIRGIPLSFSYLTSKIFPLGEFS